MRFTVNMVTRNIPRRKRKSNLTIAEAARQLGVSKPHLWYVVNGIRVSHSLSRRYAQLKKKAA